MGVEAVAKVYGDKWETIESLPEGGQAFTYLVRKIGSDDRQQYVLKRLKDPERIGRFRNEIEAGLKLEHKNIVRVIDSNLEADPPYIVTKHYRGGSLDKNPPFSRGLDELLDLYGQVCDGMAYAHSKGVIHRDLKPGNIFLEEGPTGHSVVGDFGLCFIEDGERVTLSEEGAVGSRYFTAPELEAGPGQAVTPAEPSDVYSLGKLLYWLMSGGQSLPREGHREGGANLVALTNNIYMEHVSRLLDGMMVYDPAARWRLDRVRTWLPNIRRLVVKEYNPVGPGRQTRCNYCGIGAYKYVGRDQDTVTQENFATAGHPAEWRVLVCDYCSHVQWFRPDIGRRIAASDSTPWDEPPP